jgi:hypothetical protein
MKRFISRVSIFIILFVSFVGSLYILSDIYLNQRKQYFLKLNSNVRMIFAGDSNVECAINDSIILNSTNIAESGEAYLYTYSKLKALFDYNNQINTVFLGFSFSDIEKGTEDRWLFDNGSIIEKNKSYNYLLDYPERALILKGNPKSYIQGIRDYTMANIIAILKSYRPNKNIDFGGYKYLIRDKLQENIKRYNSSKDYAFQEGKYQVKYLRMISELCHQKSVKLILFNAPKHKYYTSTINPDLKKRWISIRNSLENDSLLDISSISLPDSCYGDLTHLNYKGAKIISKYLNEKISLNLNSQLSQVTPDHSH